MERQHTITFTFPNSIRSSIINWTKLAQNSLSSNPVSDLSNNVMNSQKTVISQSESTKIFHLEDVLETNAVQLATSLISNLGYPISSVRIKSATLLTQLAAILDEKFLCSDPKIDNAIGEFLADINDNCTRIHNLFQSIGKSLNLMAIALVARLEVYRKDSDWYTRGVCNSALVRLVFENEKIFQEEDNLAAIWNLFFLLGSTPHDSTTIQDRIVIIKGLGLLAPLYVKVDTSLARNVIECLLRLKIKFHSEIAEIKNSIQNIFSNSNIKSDATTKDQNNGIGFKMFLNILNSYDESSFELLGWAFQKYLLFALPVTPEGRLKSGSFLLNDFLTSLTNHYRSSSPIIRYGACIFLYNALKLSPNLLDESRHLFIFIASGLVDTDYLTTLLYLGMIDLADGPDIVEAKELIQLHRSKMNVGYEAGIFKIIHSIIKVSPPLTIKLLQKLTTALEYLPLPLKLKQLELIGSWAGTCQKVDMFFLQTVSPLTKDSNPKVQHSALKICRRFLPALRLTSAGEISFLWSYIASILNIETESSVLLEGLQLAREYPLDIMPREVIEEYLFVVFRLTLSSCSTIRMAAYENLGALIPHSITLNLVHLVNAILILSLGDEHIPCIDLIITYLINKSGIFLGNSMNFLDKIKAATDGSRLMYFEILDSFATSISASGEKELIEYLGLPSLIDQYWYFFAADSPDDQIINPDDYNFSATFVHSSSWIAIICSKLNLYPPPFLNDLSARRDTMPATYIGKRRFILGFMSTILPSCGSANIQVRKISCVSLVKCCIKGLSLNYERVMTLLELTCKQMIPCKNLTYQCSALLIISLIIRLKIPQISRSLMIYNMDQVIGMLHNTSSTVLKMAAFDFILVSLLSFPNCIATKLEEIRDLARSSLVDKNDPLSYMASNIYLLVFRNASISHMDDFQDYVSNELYTLNGENNASIASDPWLSKLDTFQLARVKCIDIQALGMLEDTASAYIKCQNLLKFFSNPDPSVRSAALSSILTMLPLLDTAQSAVIIWIILPLYADPIKKVRLVFIRFLRNMPSLQDSLSKVLPKSAEDNIEKTNLQLEDIPQLDFSFKASKKVEDSLRLEQLSLSPKDISDIPYDLYELIAERPLESMPIEYDGFYLPTVSEKLIKRFHVLSQSMAGIVPDRNAAEVLFYLQDMKNNSANQLGAILVMSQFAVIHEGTSAEISDLLINEVGRDLNSENIILIEACIAGLKKISEGSARALKQIVGKILSSPASNEGDILTLIVLAQSIREQCGDNITEIIQKFCPVINSDRFSIQKRIYALYLVVEMAPVLNESDLYHVCEAVNTFLENNNDSSLHFQVISSLTAVVKLENELKTPLHRKLVEIARKEIESTDPKRRLKSLDCFPVFMKVLSQDELTWFILLYLADSNEEVQQKAKIIFSENGFFEPLMAKMSSLNSNEVNSLPADLSKIIEIPSVVGFSNDDFNLKYYNSECRKQFMKFYGLSESYFQRSTLPHTLGIFQSILDKYKAGNYKPEFQKNAKIAELKTSLLLHQFLSCNKMVGNDLVSALLEMVESNIRQETFDNENEARQTFQYGDQDSSSSLIHQLNVISNFIIAFEGIEGSNLNQWVKQMQDLIHYCSEGASNIRDSLFANLEDSFFYCSEFVDIPIFDDEQYEAVKSIRQLNQEASLEIVKTGRSNKLSSLEEKTSELTAMIDTKSERLSALNSVSLNLLSALSKFISITNETDEKILVEYFEFLSQYLKNEHRGLRILAIDGLSLFLSSQLGKSKEAAFKPFLKERLDCFIVELIGKCSQDGFGERADFLCLLAQLSSLISDQKVISQIITLLIDGWRDIDSNVRKTCIKMIQYIGILGIPLKDYQLRLRSEAIDLISLPEYPDKEILQELMLKTSLESNKAQV